eukprot:g16123.t1
MPPDDNSDEQEQEEQSPQGTSHGGGGSSDQLIVSPSANFRPRNCYPPGRAGFLSFRATGQLRAAAPKFRDEMCGIKLAARNSTVALHAPEGTRSDAFLAWKKELEFFNWFRKHVVLGLGPISEASFPAVVEACKELKARVLPLFVGGEGGSDKTEGGRFATGATKGAAPSSDLSATVVAAAVPRTAAVDRSADWSPDCKAAPIAEGLSDPAVAEHCFTGWEFFRKEFPKCNPQKFLVGRDGKQRRFGSELLSELVRQEERLPLSNPLSTQTQTQTLHPLLVHAAAYLLEMLGQVWLGGTTETKDDEYKVYWLQQALKTDGVLLPVVEQIAAVGRAWRREMSNPVEDPVAAVWRDSAGVREDLAALVAELLRHPDYFGREKALGKAVGRKSLEDVGRGASFMSISTVSTALPSRQVTGTSAAPEAASRQPSTESGPAEDDEVSFADAELEKARQGMRRMQLLHHTAHLVLHRPKVQKTSALVALKGVANSLALFRVRVTIIDFLREEELLRGCLPRQAFCGRASNHDRGSPKQWVKRVLGSKSFPLYFYFALRQKLYLFLFYLFLIPSALFPHITLVQGIGFVDGPHPLHCPVKFEELFDAVQTGASLYNENRIKESKETLTGYLQKWANADPLVGMECSLGMAAAYRTLTFAYCANPRTNNRRAYQIGLRILHQAMNWITHVFVKSQHDADMIDGSKWPITIQQINDELTIIQNVLKQDGISNGHQLHPRFAKDLVQLNWQPKAAEASSSWMGMGGGGGGGKNKHDIKIVSLCAYPEDHVLPRYATSNHQIYAKKHGYSYYVERSRLDKDRPHAWGKIKVVEQQLSQPDGPEWVMWFDCDTYFMNMTVTIESLAERERAAASGRAQQPRFETRSKIHSTDDIVLDPSVHLIIAEDNAMLNSGTFFIRKSEWSVNLMRQVWGDPKTSPWIDHPWWENAALTWYFLKDVPRTFVNDDTLESWPTLSSGGASGIQLGGSAGGGYQQQKTFAELGEEEKNYWISKEMENIYTPEVRIAPQHVFNSYHPVTSRFQHDTWEPGKACAEPCGASFPGLPCAVEYAAAAWCFALFCSSVVPLWVGRALAASGFFMTQCVTLSSLGPIVSVSRLIILVAFCERLSR